MSEIDNKDIFDILRRKQNAFTDTEFNRRLVFSSKVMSLVLLVSVTMLPSINPVLFVYSQLNENQKKKVKILEQDVIINLYYRKQNSNLLFVLIRALWTILALILVKHFLWSSVSIIPIITVILATIALLYIRTLVIKYRILRGYFGTNRHEASEIINLIQEQSDDIDSSGGEDGKVFPKDVLSELQAEISIQGAKEAI